MSVYPEVSLAAFAWFQEGPGLRQWQWTSEGMKVINVTNILGDGSIDVNNTARFISTQEFDSRYRHFAVEPGDVLVASSGNTYGKVGRIRSDQLPVMMNTSVIRFHSKDQEVLTDDYLYTYLRSGHFKNQVEMFVTGGAQPNFGPSHLKQMRLVMPPIGAQLTIAASIKSYDGLIENNRRRIKLLHAAARLIYREWFVHLRFPGNEHFTIENGLPEGWVRTEIRNLCETLGGGTPSTQTPAFWDGDIPWVVPSDVTKNSQIFLPSTAKSITEAGLRASSAKMLTADCILMTSRASVGYFALVDKPVCTNQGFINIVPKRQSLRLYILFTLMDRVEEIRSLAGGSTFPEISKSKFREIKLVVPTESLLVGFQEKIGPIIDQIRVLTLQGLRLVQARDLLLPRLMSGEIEV